MRTVVWLLAALCCIVVAGLLSGAAQAEKRAALIVGNAKYAHIAGLPNVPNDVAAMAALFKSAKFDNIDVMHNLGVGELRRALKLFAEKAADADTAVLYYAGHGIEVGQANYLIPVDARLATDFDVEDETVSLDRALQAMAMVKRLRLVILDACRENPFVGSMKRTVATRSVGRGLGRVEPATPNTLIAFATKPNAIAEDGKGPNSPFTAALVKHLLRPGLDLRIALGNVRDEVLASTGRRQEPYVTSSLGGGVVSIVPGASGSAPIVAVRPSEAAEAWAAVKGHHQRRPIGDHRCPLQGHCLRQSCSGSDRRIEETAHRPDGPTCAGARIYGGCILALAGCKRAYHLRGACPETQGRFQGVQRLP